MHSKQVFVLSAGGPTLVTERQFCVFSDRYALETRVGSETAHGPDGRVVIHFGERLCGSEQTHDAFDGSISGLVTLDTDSFRKRVLEATSFDISRARDVRYQTPAYGFR